MQEKNNEIKLTNEALFKKVIGSVELIITPITPQKWLDMAKNLDKEDLVKVAQNVVTSNIKK